MNFNKVVIGGHLTRDWELRSTQGGMQVAKGGIAINRRSREREEVCFVDLVAFGQQAETLAQHTQKGRSLLVEGRLSLQQWEDKDGNRRSKHEVVVEAFQFVGGKEEGSPPQDRRRRHPDPELDSTPF